MDDKQFNTSINVELKKMNRTLHKAFVSEKEPKRKSSNWFIAFLKSIFSNWAVFLFILSIFGALVGWLVFDVSLLQPIEEVAYKQSEYRLRGEQEKVKQEMVNSHLKLGNEFLNVMQLDAAGKEFEEALKLDPLNISSQKGLFKSEIFAPIIEGDYDPEIMEKRLKLILQETPNDPHAYLFLGTIYRDIDSDIALKYYQKAIQEDPEIAAAYFGIGIIYDERNENDKALEMYEKALSLSKWNQVFLHNMGYQFYIRNEYEKAISIYELLLKLNPQSIPAYYFVSNSYLLTGRIDQALRDQEILINLLDDENVTSMRTNKLPWKDENVYFYNYPKQKFFADYNLALTYYLLGNENKSLEFIKKGNNLKLDKAIELDVKKLIRFNIDKLQEMQTGLVNKTEEFRRRFL